MKFNKFAESVYDKGKNLFSELELYYSSEERTQIGVFNGQVDRFSVSESSGVSLRGITEEGVGYSYSEKMDEESAEILVKESAENCKYADSKEFPVLPKLIGSRQIDKKNHKDLQSLSVDKKIQIMLDLEKKAHLLDNRIVTTQLCKYEEFVYKRDIRNSNGVELWDVQMGGYAYISVIAKENDDTRTGDSICIFRDPKEINIDKLAEEAANEAISQLGAKPVKSGVYQAIIKNRVFSDIIEGYIPALTAENIHKGISVFRDKTGIRVGSSALTIVEDPSIEAGLGGCEFDDEGYPTKYKTIVREGILEEILYNSRTSSKDSKSSSGNGFRNSYKSPVGTRPTNLFVVKGKRDRDSIMKEIDSGIYITDVAGLHSGLDYVSGDFSLQAQGYMIDVGKQGMPVKGITISGNILGLLESIEEVSDDLEFGFPGNGQYGSPSVKIKGISVSGN